jgi:ElaB/YqjD/DUF883 family membrane-anchored ribosome-binding protein
MDKGMDRIAQDMKDIVETRTAIADKLGQLEHRFASTVEEAKTMAENFADRTQSMIEGTMNSVKEATDPSRLVSQHPWVMVSGGIVVGYALGRLFRQGGNGVIPYYPPGSHAANVMPPSGADTTGREGVYPFYPQPEGEDSSRSLPSTRSSILGSLGPVFAESLGDLTAELVDIGKSALRAWLKEVAQGQRARPSASGRWSPREGNAREHTSGEPEQQRDPRLVDA